MVVVIEISKARKRRVGSVTARRASHSVAPDTARGDRGIFVNAVLERKAMVPNLFIAEIEPTSRDLTLNLSLVL
jgi:hypothetical protein